MEVQEAEKCTLLSFPISSEKSSTQRWTFLRRKRNFAIYQVEKNEEDKAECKYKLLACSVSDGRGSYSSTSLDIDSNISCSGELSDSRGSSEVRVGCGLKESRDCSEKVNDLTEMAENNRCELTNDFNLLIEGNKNDDLVNNENKLFPQNFDGSSRSSQTSARRVTNEHLKLQTSNRHSIALEMPRNTSEYLSVRQNIQARRLANHFLFNSDDDEIENNFVNQESEESEKEGSHSGIVESPNNANHEPNSETRKHELIELNTSDTIQCSEQKYASSVSSKPCETLSESDLQKMTSVTSIRFKKNFNPFSKFFNTASKSKEMLVPDEYTTKEETASYSRKSYYRVNDPIRSNSQHSVPMQTYRKTVNDFERDRRHARHSDYAREQEETTDQETLSVPLLRETSPQMDLENRTDVFSDSRSVNDHMRSDSTDLLLDTRNLDLKSCIN